VPKEKIFAQARDELFSHINRCGVLSATDDDRTTWMTETIDYIGERYPDLVDPDLRELHAVGIRFCQPAINNVPAAVAAEPVSGADAETTVAATATDASEVVEVPEVVDAPEVAEVPEVVDAPGAAARPVSQTS